VDTCATIEYSGAMNGSRLGLIVFSVLLVIGAFFAVSTLRAPEQAPTTTLKAAASFYPLAEFARQVGKNLVDVQQIIPAGIEAHDFEPSAKTIASIHAADVFLFLGAGFDPWASDIDDELEQSGILTVRITRFLDLQQRNTTLDPHVWLDPSQAQEIVRIIRDAFQNADPEHPDEFDANADAYLANLATLDTQYETALKNCERDTIVSNHDAFGYLAHRYGFKIQPIAGLSPHDEPSAADLAKLTQFIRDNNVHYILTEPLSSPQFAQTLAMETGVKLLPLDPIESITNDQTTRGDDYISIMTANLATLTTALQCTTPQSS